MKKPEIIMEKAGYKAVNLGDLKDLGDYSYLHPLLKMEIQGKYFLSESVLFTGCEISFQIMMPHTEIPFLHVHNENEEIYIFLKGKGEFFIDNDVFEVKEGTVIRVSPEAKRSWRNNSGTELILMVIQAKKDSLNNFFVSDGKGLKDNFNWNDIK